MNNISNYIDSVKNKASKTFCVQLNEVHFGHTILQVLTDYPDFIAQIDAVTGDSKTFNEVRTNTIRLSLSLRKYGLQVGDVVLLVIPNDKQTSSLLYAGLINGFPILPIDQFLLYSEVDRYINLGKPKIVFCVKNKEEMVVDILRSRNIEAKVVVIDDVNNDIDVFTQNYNISNSEVDAFKPSSFNLRTPALLLSTSGTTGQPKVSIINHDNLFIGQKSLLWQFKNFPKPTESTILLAPPQWLTSIIQYCCSALSLITIIQSNIPFVGELTKKTFDKYKPTFIIGSTVKFLELYRDKCDFSRVEYILTGGTSVIETLDNDFKASYPNTFYASIYGMTESYGVCLELDFNGPRLSLGKEFPKDMFQYRLVDISTGKDITEPNTVGELLLKCKSPFEGYYNNIEDTAAAFSDNGYLKTGDLFYKDTEGYYYFVERIKTLMKYRGYHVYPSEIEEILRKNPAVLNAAVSGITDVICGDIPVAVVVLRKNCSVTAHELHDMVRKELSDEKQLRGGIMFRDSLPLTPTYKVSRTKLREIVNSLTAKFEF